MFNKNQFIAANDKKIFLQMKNFLSAENKEIIEDLKILLMNDNLRGFTYEGNMYTIQKNPDDTIDIIDSVAEKYGVRKEQTRFSISKNKMVEILSEADSIIQTE